MPKLTVTYTLPEEYAEYEAARLGPDAVNALWQIDQYCRDILKHRSPSDEARELCERIRVMIPEDCLRGV